MKVHGTCERLGTDPYTAIAGNALRRLAVRLAPDDVCSIANGRISLNARAARCTVQAQARSIK